MDHRESAKFGPDATVFVAAFDYAPGEVVAAHEHPWAQLIHCTAGVMTVRTTRAAWVVPPGRGLWMPPAVTHEVIASGHVAMRTLYLDAALAGGMGDGCRLLTVGPLLRELLVRASTFVRGRRTRSEQLVLAVAIDELARAPADTFHLPLPADDRLARVAAALQLDPGDGRSLAEWGSQVGASERTLSRLFVSETGMSFRAWRQQARLARAVAMLAEGEPVTRIAATLGYDSPSAFTAMFRSSMGVPPAHYLAAG